MVKIAESAIFFVLLTFTACGQPKEGDKNQETVAPQQGKTGSDRDAHGCIGSAGYHWCERIDKCVRPWELAKEVGFNKDEKTFEKFCQPKQKEKQ
ncbi:peptidase [Nitratifractor sp.]|uniref:peptidase n=1 Tax=Nitratifractor sp. TaxID=2268144 RepID=UPI0025F901E0|nr:peptidase [Nitratifractor sp.]